MSMLKTKLVPFALISALLLVACTETAPKKAEPPPPEPEVVVPVEPEPPPLEDLTPSGHIRRAIALIQQGDTAEARRHLNATLEKKPRNRVATSLLEQLDADPRQMLGAASFPYQVQSGESLSLIAKKFMGDPLMFVILARYNGIDDPSRLEVGRTLQIPEKYRSAKPRPEPLPVEMDAEEQAAMQSAIEDAEAMAPATDEAPAQSLPEAPAAVEPVAEAEPEPAEMDTAARAFDEARTLYEQGDYKDAVVKLEMALIADPDAKARYSGLLVDAYSGYAAQLEREGDLAKARDTLNRALEVAPDNSAIVLDLARVEDKLEAKRQFQSGEAAMKGGDLEKAYKAFNSAVTYDGRAEYREARDQAGEQLADQYHRKAMEHYRRQELVEARAYWRKVLEVDPGNTLAPGYLSKVEEILKRLKGFE